MVAVHLFAYGSNMSIARLRERAPSASMVGVGELADHRLHFSRRSQISGGGVANALPAPGFGVMGAVYNLEDQDLVTLDKAEGLFLPSPAYERLPLSITLNSGGRILAETYRVVSPSKEEVAPRPEYLDLILTGLREARELEFGRLNSSDAYQVRRLDDYISFVTWLGNLAPVVNTDERPPQFIRPGLMVVRTGSNRGSGGFGPVIEVNPTEARGLGRISVVQGTSFSAFAQVRKSSRIKIGQVALDQELRRALGITGQRVYGFTVTLARARALSTGIIPVRSVTLRLSQARAADAERNLCILHPRHIQLLGIRAGDFVDILLPLRSGHSYSSKCLTIRCIEAMEIAGINYPSLERVYLDEQTRERLGIDLSLPYLGMPILVRPNPRHAIQSRIALYGLTVLLGISAFTDLISRLSPLQGPAVGVCAAALAVVVTCALAASDLRAKMQP